MKLNLYQRSFQIEALYGNLGTNLKISTFQYVTNILAAKGMFFVTQ